MDSTLIHGIALRTVRYNERNDILSLYTAELGRMSVLVSAGTSAATRRRRALTMPLSLIECVVRNRPGRELSPIRDLRPTLPLPMLHSDPVRISIAMFMAEILWHVLPEGDADKGLWRFLADAIAFLDATHNSIANIHLAMLMGMSHFLGIAPDSSTYRPGRVFDMAGGRFLDSPPIAHNHWLEASDAEALNSLQRITLTNSHLFTMSRAQRQRALDLTLQYYTLHYAPLSRLQSLDILRNL
ncbi:MAG: DNA repair protein RecO [Muribaculum sp.]|nr:DNA repair protein RecO [Muribaculaceae bacterium]MCM1080214.1 DNA repair protein RecO [Muribaculum sp.]